LGEVDKSAARLTAQREMAKIFQTRLQRSNSGKLIIRKRKRKKAGPQKYVEINSKPHVEGTGNALQI
jgi:hypothetical protein